MSTTHAAVPEQKKAVRPFCFRGEIRYMFRDWGEERNDATAHTCTPGPARWARPTPAAWSLGWIGYQSGTGTIVQTDEVLEGIYNLATLVPALLLLVSTLALAFWYPLSKKRVDENVALLAERHEAAAEEN